MTNLKSNLIVFAAALSALTLVSACSKDDNKSGVPAGPNAYIAQFPQECQAPVNTGNPTYNRGDDDDDYDRDHDRDRHRNHRTYHPDQGDQQPTYQPAQGQPTYQPPVYQQPPYQPQQGYPQQGYPQPTYPQPGYPQQPMYQQNYVQYAGVHYGVSITFYKNAGCVPYNWNRAGRFHHGGCPRGTFAACAPGAGLICMPGDAYNNYQIAWYNYQQGSRTAGLCGYESRQTAGACSYRSRNDGSGNIGRACAMSHPETCGTGRCAPISDGSQAGVCVR